MSNVSQKDVADAVYTCMAETFQATTLQALEDELKTKLDGIITTFHSSVQDAVRGVPVTKPASGASAEDMPEEMPRRQPTGPLSSYHGEGPGRLPWRPGTRPPQAQQSTTTSEPRTTGEKPFKMPPLKDLLGYSKWMLRGGPWRNLPGKQYESYENVDSAFAEMDRIAKSMLDFMVESSNQLNPAVIDAVNKLTRNLHTVVFDYMRKAYKIGLDDKSQQADEEDAASVAAGKGTEEKASNWFVSKGKQISMKRALTIGAYLEDRTELSDLDTIQNILDNLGYKGTAENAVKRIKLAREKASSAIGSKPVETSSKNKELQAPLTHEPVSDEEAMRHLSSLTSEFEED